MGEFHHHSAAPLVHERRREIGQDFADCRVRLATGLTDGKAKTNFRATSRRARLGALPHMDLEPTISGTLPPVNTITENNSGLRKNLSFLKQPRRARPVQFNREPVAYRRIGLRRRIVSSKAFRDLSGRSVDRLHGSNRQWPYSFTR